MPSPGIPTSATKRRAARGLTAWLSTAEARRLRGRSADPQRERRARERLRDRPEQPDQTGLLAAWPAVLDTHGTALRASKAAQRMFDQGWELAVIADARRLIAAQPTVFVDELPGDAVPATAAELAAFALPVNAPSVQVPARLDEDTQTWFVSSPNPNLRITGTFGGEVAPGTLGFGFMFEVMASYVSVAEQGGRFILRDGYHRLHRLIAAGIIEVPAFVRGFDNSEPLFRGGMLSTQAYLGPRPPTLADFDDELLAEDVWVPVTDTTAQVRATPTNLAVGKID